LKRPAFWGGGKKKERREKRQKTSRCPNFSAPKEREVRKSVSRRMFAQALRKRRVGQPCLVEQGRGKRRRTVSFFAAQGGGGMLPVLINYKRRGEANITS